MRKWGWQCDEVTQDCEIKTFSDGLHVKMKGSVGECNAVHKITNSQWKYTRVSWWEWLCEPDRDTEYEDELTSDSVNASSSEWMWEIGWVRMLGHVCES